MSDFNYDPKILLTRKDRAEIRRRQERRSRGKSKRYESIPFKFLGAIFAVIVFVGITVLGISHLDLTGIKNTTASLPKNAKNTLRSMSKFIPHKSSPPKTGAIKAEAAKTFGDGIKSCLIIGSSGAPKHEEAVGLFLIVLDDIDNELHAVSIPPNAFENVPGYGYEKLSLSLKIGGARRTLSAVKNFLSVPVDHYIKIRNQDFEELAVSDGFSEMIARALETDMNSKEKINLAYKLSKIDSSRIEVVELPGKKLDMGTDDYFAVEEKQTSYLMNLIYDVGKTKRVPVTRVQVLNGCGVPGCTAPVQERLIDAGFRVEESKNADHFGYSTTQIITYMDTDKEATRVCRLLGAGDIIRKKAPQELVDVIVIIGNDLSQGLR